MGVLDEHLGVLIEPVAGAGSALHAALAIRLTTGLDPDNGVNDGVVGLGGGDLTEAGLDVAPLTPLLAGAQETNAALVDDEVGGETLSLKEGSQRGGVVGLVPRVGPLSVVLTDSGVVGVVVGNVGRETTDIILALAGKLDDLGELLGRCYEEERGSVEYFMRIQDIKIQLTKREVVIPSQPATVGSINVQVHVLVLEALDGVGDTRGVDGSGLLTLRDAHVGNEVTKRIGLEDNGEVQVGSTRELLGIRLDELLLVALKAVLLALELTGRLASRAVAVGEVVEDQADDLLLTSLALDLTGLLDSIVDTAKLRKAGHPHEGADFLDLPDVGGVDLVTLGKEGAAGLLELLGPFGVDKVLLAGEGVNVLGGLGSGRVSGDGTGCGEGSDDSGGGLHFVKETM